MRPLVALALLLASSAQLSAAELIPLAARRENAMTLGAELKGLRFPQSLTKDLRSGLTHRILVRVSLQVDLQRTSQRMAELTVKYDLWDEVYEVAMRIDGALAFERTHARAEEVTALLSDLRLPDLFSLQLPSKAQLKLEAQLLVNPIEQARLDKIKEWVKENSSYVPLDVAGKAGSGNSSNAMFNRIFEQYASGAGAAAAWRQDVSAGPFRAEDLIRDRP